MTFKFIPTGFSHRFALVTNVVHIRSLYIHNTHTYAKVYSELYIYLQPNFKRELSNQTASDGAQRERKRGKRRNISHVPHANFDSSSRKYRMTSRVIFIKSAAAEMRRGLLDKLIFRCMYIYTIPRYPILISRNFML